MQAVGVQKTHLMSTISSQLTGSADLGKSKSEAMMRPKVFKPVDALPLKMIDMSEPQSVISVPVDGVVSFSKRGERPGTNIPAKRDVLPGGKHSTLRVSDPSLK